MRHHRTDRRLRRLVLSAAPLALAGCIALAEAAPASAHGFHGRGFFHGPAGFFHGRAGFAPHCCRTFFGDQFVAPRPFFPAPGVIVVNPPVRRLVPPGVRTPFLGRFGRHFFSHRVFGGFHHHVFGGFRHHDVIGGFRHRVRPRVIVIGPPGTVAPPGPAETVIVTVP